MSGFSVRCTLWGNQAESFNHHDNPVIGIKGAKVGDYGGRTLSVAYGGTIQLNPDVPIAHTLRGWFDSTGNSAVFQTFSSMGDGGATGPRQDLFKTIQQVADEKLGFGEKPDYFSLTATISHIRQENCWYPACPNEGCNKKVMDMNSEWRCEKCDKSFARPNYRYILSFSVSDYSGQLWLQAFNDQAEQILGKTANDLQQLRENSGEDAYKEVFQEALFKEFTFKVRAKAETYQDDKKVRSSVVQVQPIDFHKTSLEMISLIDSYKR
jgi:replication factor A1